MKPKPEPEPDLCAEWELQRDIEQELADAQDDDDGRRESAGMAIKIMGRNGFPIP